MAATRTPLQLSPNGPHLTAGLGRRLSAAQPYTVPTAGSFPSLFMAAGSSTYSDSHASSVVTEALRTGKLTLEAESRTPGSIYTSGGNAVQFEATKDGVDLVFWDGQRRLASGATFFSDELPKAELDAVWQRGLVRVVP